MTQNRQTTFEEFTRHLSDERKHLIKTWLDEKSWGETVKLTAMHTITQELDGAGVTIWNMSDKYAQVLAYHRGDEDTRHGTGYLNMETLEYTLLVHVRDGSHESIHVQTECMTEVMDIWSQLTELGEQNMGDDKGMTNEELLTQTMRGERVTQEREVMYHEENETGTVTAYNARHGNILQVEGRDAAGYTYVGYWNDSTGDVTLTIAYAAHGAAWAHVFTHIMGDVYEATDFIEWANSLKDTHGTSEQNMGDDGHQQYARSEHHIPLHDVQHEGETLVWRRDDAEVRYDFIHGTKNMYRISGHAEQLIFTGYWDAMEGIAHLTAGLTPPHGDVEYSDDGVQHVHVTGELYTPHEMFLAIAEQLAKDTADLEDFLRKNKNS